MLTLTAVVWICCSFLTSPSNASEQAVKSEAGKMEKILSKHVQKDNLVVRLQGFGQDRENKSYKGTLRRNEEGKMFGVGVWADVNIYEGEWIFNAELDSPHRCGFGKYKAVEGLTFEGEWQNNLMHGRIRETHGNKIFIGEMYNRLWRDGSIAELGNGKGYSMAVHDAPEGWVKLEDQVGIHLFRMLESYFDSMVKEKKALWPSPVYSLKYLAAMKANEVVKDHDCP